MLAPLRFMFDHLDACGSIGLVGDASDLLHVGEPGGEGLHPGGELLHEPALTRPQVRRCSQADQVGVEGQLPDGEVDYGVAGNVEDLQASQVGKSCVLNACDEIALKVELAEMDHAIEFKALQDTDLVILQMKRAKAFQSIERLVLNFFNV